MVPARAGKQRARSRSAKRDSRISADLILRVIGHSGARCSCESSGQVFMLYAIRLYARMAKKYATTVIATHHARAIHISFLTGWFDSSARIALTIEVTG
jgi:hypothetical protein